MAKKPYDAKEYYKVTQTHAVFFVLGVIFASLGCHYTSDRVIIERTENETEEGKPEQQRTPYWVAGYVLGGLNLFLALLSFGVYRRTSRGKYTEARKKCAKDLDGIYRLYLLGATIWGVVGAVFTGLTGVAGCTDEGDEACYYVYTHYTPNKAFAIVQIVIHVLWFFTALELCSTTVGVKNQIDTIRVGTNLDGSPPAATAARSQPNRTNQGASGSTPAPQPSPKPPTRAEKPPLPPLTTPSAPPYPPSIQLVPPGTPHLPSEAPPSYDEAVSNPYTISYSDPSHYSQPQNLYSNWAFPDGVPSVAHANNPNAARQS